VVVSRTGDSDGDKAWVVILLLVGPDVGSEMTVGAEEAISGWCVVGAWVSSLMGSLTSSIAWLLLLE